MSWGQVFLIIFIDFLVSIIRMILGQSSSPESVQFARMMGENLIYILLIFWVIKQVYKEIKERKERKSKNVEIKKNIDDSTKVSPDIKNNAKYTKWLILLCCIAILGFIFYWYEWRPSIIKNECSWIVIKSDHFLTAEEFLKSKKEGRSIIVPKRQATEEEYRFCIHNKGL